MKHLLVATDLSARSDRALERAVRLAHLHGAALTVLHVIDENLPAPAIEQVAAAAERAIRACLAELTQKDDDISIRMVTGNAFRKIVETADSEGCDLIVLGRHRNESSQAAFGGTTMGRVVRTSLHPVLLVSDRVEGDYGRVMVAVDFSAFSRTALQAAQVLAPGAGIHAVHAFDVPFQGFLPGAGVRRQEEREHERALTRFIDEAVPALAGAGMEAAAPPVEAILRQGDIIGVLRQEVERLRPDLLAVGTHGRTGLVGAVLGSVAQNLLNHPPCDLLVVKSGSGQA